MYLAVSLFPSSFFVIGRFGSHLYLRYIFALATLAFVLLFLKAWQQGDSNAYIRPRLLLLCNSRFLLLFFRPDRLLASAGLFI